jgi:site-specific DNA recombinase
VTKADIYKEQYTGTNLHDRPVLNQLRERLRAGAYQALAVYQLDRLSRSAAHLAIISDELDRHNATLISATEDIDRSPEGQLMLAVKGYAAELERTRILERTGRVIKKLLDENKLICAGKPRLGYAYDLETRTRVINEQSAPIVRRIFQLAAEGVSITRICLIMNGEGAPTPHEFNGQARGRLGWGKQTVRGILRDPSYKGEAMSWGKTRVVGRRKNGRPDTKYTQPDDQRLIGEPTPALVSPQVWQAAQATINRGRTYINQINIYKSFKMLAGMVKCGCCGGTMTTQKKPGRGGKVYFYYTCLNRRNKQTQCVNPRQQIHLVEQSVWKQVRDFLGDDAAIKRAVRRAQGEQDSLARELEAHREALRTAEKQAAGLVGALGGLEDAVVLEPLRKRLSALSGEAQTHRRAIAELEARQMTEGMIVLCLRHHEDFLAGRLRLDVHSPQERRELLLGLGCRVVLQDKLVKVELDVPLVADGPVLVSATNSPTRRGSSTATSNPPTC